MNIGKTKIHGFAALAPMAGVADRAMREICIEMGAAFCIGELTSSRGVSLGDKKSAALLCCGEKERPIGSQLFGNDPDIMAHAAKSALSFNPDFIDINMGCPAPKVAGNGGGSALLKDPELAGRVVRAVKDAVDVPVTVKIRIGWDDSSINDVLMAKICEENGADAITVHGRTRVQMYAPGVRIDRIAAVKRAVKIPVIANGDVCDYSSAKAMYEQTGCDLVMIGRAAMGDPWVFSRINEAFKTGKEPPMPDLRKRLEMARREIELMVKYKGERTAFLESRKHLAWYMKGLRAAASLRLKCGEISSIEDVDTIINLALESNEE